MSMRTNCAPPIAVASMARRVAGWQQRHRATLRTVQLGVAVAGTMAFIVTSNAFAAIPDMTWRDRSQLVLVIVASLFSVVALQLAVLRLMVLSRRAPRALRIVRYSVMVLLGTIANTFGLLFDAAPLRLGVVESAVTGFWWSLFQSLLVATFLVYQHAGVARSEEASRRLRELQREQRAARRRLVEVQLQALQARVDPQMFFDVLDSVQRLYATDAPRAEALLDELIVFLRAALPRLRAVSSTLAQELELAASYFRLRSLRGDAQAGVHINLPDALAPRAFPAGVILPLLAEARTAAIDVHADPGAGRNDMSVSLRGERPPATQALQQVRATLAALYGSAATLECHATAAGANVETRITIAHAAS
jgi:hypothetical protein